jgi:hypothetical protein
MNESISSVAPSYVIVPPIVFTICSIVAGVCVTGLVAIYLYEWIFKRGTPKVISNFGDGILKVMERVDNNKYWNKEEVTDTNKEVDELKQDKYSDWR